MYSIVGRSTQYSSGFDLRQIPGLALWLDAQDTSSFDLSGGPTGIYLTSWRDKSGTGKTATPVSNAIWYDVGSQRMRFNANDYLAITPELSSGAVVESVFFVISSVTSGTYYMLGLYPDSAVAGRRFVMGTSNVRTEGGVTLTSSNVLLNDRTRIVSYVNTGQIVTHYVNGTAASTRTSVGLVGGNGTSVGGDTSASGSGYRLIGSLGEVIVYQSALTDGQRQAVEQYLFTKWKTPTTTISSPLDISGCVLWLDGSDSSTISARQWNDKSGLGYHAVVGSTSNLTTLYGAPYFSNTSALTATPHPTSNETMFIALRNDLSTNTSTPIGAQNRGTFVGRALQAASGNYSLYNGNYNQTGGTGPKIDPLMPVVYDHVLNDGYGKTHVFTNRVLCRDVAAVVFALTGGSVIGAQTNAAAPASAFIGNIYEVLLYGSNLSSYDRGRVRNYLMNKWNITDVSAMPSTNPHADLSFPPRVVPARIPIDIQGCYMWYDASDPNSMTLSGSNVTTWFDKSGNNNHISNAVTVSGPTYSNNAVSFNGTTQFLSNTTLSVPFINHTLVAVHRPTVIDASNNGNTNLFRFQPTAPNYTAFPSMNGTIPRGYTHSANASALITNSTLVENSVTTRYNIIVANSMSCNVQVHNNGTLQSSITTAQTTGGNISNFSMGKHNLSNSQFYQGTVQELIVFTKALSDAERQVIEGYLATKWGLLGSLPANHPVKSQIQYKTPFNPKNISNVSLWLDAADRSTMTFSGSNIAQWNDKSGLGYHAITQGVGPTYNSTTNSIVFTGGQNLRGAANFLHSSVDGTWSIYVVAFTSIMSPITNLINYDVTPNRIAQFIRVETNGTLGTIGFASSNVNAAYAATTTAAITSNVRFLFGGINTSSNLTAYLGGTAGTPVVHTASVVLSNNFYSVGVYQELPGNGYIGGYWGGEISEIIVFSKASSTLERQEIEGYLAWKWGLVGTLPSTHPYKKIRP